MVLGELLRDYAVDETVPTPIGDVTVKFDSSGLEVTANLAIAIDEFFHARGDLTLRKPFGVESVDVATGLPSLSTDLYEELITPLTEIMPWESEVSSEDLVDALCLADDLSTIKNLPVTAVEIVATDLTAFAGLKGPYWNDTNGDGVFDEDEANPDATGLAMTDVDLGFVLLVPLIPELPIFYAMEATAGSIELVGLDGLLEASASNIQVQINNSTGWPGGLFTPVIDFVASFPAETAGDTDGDGQQDPAGYEVRTGTVAPSLLLDFAGADGPLLAVSGALELNIGGIVKAAGNFDLARQSGIAITDGTISTTADVLAVELYSVHLFAGIGAGAFSYDSVSGTYTGIDTNNATGFLVSGASLDLAIVNETVGDMRRWTGVAAHVGLMTVVGVDPAAGLVVQNLDLWYNVADAGDLSKLNWDALSTQPPDPVLISMEGLDVSLDLKVSGSLALGIGSFVKAAGSFDITQQSGITLNDGSALGDINADVLMIRLSSVHLFVGMGAGAIAYDAGSKTYAGIDTSNAIGFLVSGAGLDLAIVKETVGSMRNWTGIAAHVDLMTVVGLDPAVFDISVHRLDLLYNVADTTVMPNTKLNWDDLTTDGTVLGLADLTADLTLKISGFANLSIASFAQLYGGFEISQQSDQLVTPTIGSPKNVTVTSIGFGQVNVFVGAGPYFVDSDTNGVLDGTDTPDSDAVGLLLKDVTVAVALFKPTDTADSSSYQAVYAFADDVELIGLDLGSESFTLDASGYRFEYNGGTDGASGNPAAINFAAMPGGKLTVPTGTGSVDFDYSSPLLRVAVENALLVIGEYVYVSGGFAFTYQQSLSVQLNDLAGTDRMVDVYAFGAGSVDLFVGNGPYFENTNDDSVTDWQDKRNPNAVGLAIENVNFGLLLMKPTDAAYKHIKYLAVKATADHVGLVGIDIIELSASGISVEYNSVNNSANPNDKVVVDFTATSNYLLDTGNGELVFNYGSKLLRATIAEAHMRISTYVFIHGALAFEKGEGLDVILSDDTELNASSINVGASGLTMFVGIKGPYWTDYDNDGQVSWSDVNGNPTTDDNGDGIVDADETDELNGNAVGLAITNADLAMTLVTPSTGVTKYIGLRASADEIGFVGVDVFGLEASTVQVELNLAAGGAVTDATPVVNFGASFPGEQQALFDLLAGGDGEISAADLTAAFSNNFGITEALTTVGELITLLNIGGAPTLTDLTGLVTEAAIESAITALDTDNDDKIDPIGYEIITGAGSEYLSETKRRILATADNVYINVADFLYVKGSIAIDLGSREMVTISTGIPAAFTDLAPGVVDSLNTRLDGLSASLTTLKADIQLAFENAITTVKTTLQGMVSNIVADIKLQLAVDIEAAKNFVTGNVSGALDSATSGLSIDALIDNVINPIIAGLPLQALKDLVSEMLSPIKSLLNNAFSGKLQETLGTAVNTIAGSVSGAIDAAVGKVGDAIDAAIHSVIDPQIERIELMLNRIFERIESTIAPIFTRLQGIANIDIGSGSSTLENVEVDVTAIGISNATAFVGLPPADGLDFDIPLADQDAIGLFVENFNMGLGLFKPVLSKQLPSFTAAKITADAAGFSDGGADILEIIAKVIEVELNIGGPLIKGAGALLGNATIDFVTSFPNYDTDIDGYVVQTGTTTAPIYIDFGGGELIRASVGVATLKISEFVYVTGSIAFEKGPVQTVDVTGGLLSGLTSEAITLLETLGLPTSDFPFNIPAGGATSTELSFMTVGASNVHAFIGMGGPYWVDDLDEDGNISWSFDTGDGDATSRTIDSLENADILIDGTTYSSGTLLPADTVITLFSSDGWIEVNGVKYGDIDGDGVVDADETAELSEKAAGIVVNDFDFGMAIMTPTNPVDFARYFALRATAEQVALVGIEDVTLEATHLLVEVNLSSPSIYGLPLFPVVDFPSSFPAEPDTGDLTADDTDGDGKRDPAGYEVETGGDPVYLTMDSSLIRAQGFVNLNILDSIILTGSVAFEMGPTETVTLTDGNTKDVTTMTIGAAKVSAFIGVNGPYWSDADGDFTSVGDELTEFNPDAVGFHVTDLDVGIMLMAATDPLDLGVYLAAKLNVNIFGLVGIVGLTADGAFDIKLNVGFGIDGLDASFAPVDFAESFSEVPALFELFNSTNDDIIDQAEQNAALVSGYIGTDITTVAQLVSVLNTSGSPPDDYLDINEEIVGNLKSTFITDNQAAIDDLDVDNNGRLNTGFEVNTGNEDAPVVLDFDQFLISVQLGGEIELTDVFRMYGVFLFEVDPSGLKAFVAAGIEIGPSEVSDVFSMNALGALAISAGDANSNPGIAADLNISLSIGNEELRDVLALDATARLVFNTTGENQVVTIPATYVNFLIAGGDTVPASEYFEPTQTDGLQIDLTSLPDGLVYNVTDGTATYTISAGAPLAGGDYAPHGFYLLATFNADLTIANTFAITADFRLLLTGQIFKLGFNGTIDLGGFVTLDVEGGAVIEDGVFAAYAKLEVVIKVAGIDISGIADFEVNSGSGDKSVYDALDNEHKSTGNTFRVSVHGDDANDNGMIDDDEDATIGLFTVLTAKGSVEIAVVDGEFSIDVDASLDFFGIVDVSISGFVSIANDGDISFNFTGSLGLNLTVGSGLSEFGITGARSVTIKNTGFSGHGEVGLVVLGQNSNIASAELSVDWEAGTFLIRADGLAGVWLEVTSSDSFPYFSIDGGLGALDAVFEALGDAAEAVGTAVTDAFNAVEDACDDLDNAILDCGADVLNLVRDVVVIHELRSAQQ